MIVRKIDQFVGRHMSAKRWVIVWAHFIAGGTALLATGRWFGIVLMIWGWLGLYGNLRRLR